MFSKNSDGNKLRESQATTIPAKSGLSIDSGNYIVTVGLGTPKTDQTLAFDTGSDLTWAQCKPCERQCYKQVDPIFDPSKSTSYTNISCPTPLCTQLTSSTRGSEISSSLKFTPMLTLSQRQSFYGLNLIGLSVGGQRLSIPTSVFSTAGTIIDSGTVITRLPPTAYNALRTKFREMMRNYPMTSATSPFDTCYDLSKSQSVSIPSISFFFGGDVSVDLGEVGILYVLRQTEACLAFAGNSDPRYITIFGNEQQKGLEVVYDVAGERIGFRPGGCS
nr:aspartyl protease family protein [Quercus suber]